MPDNTDAQRLIEEAARTRGYTLEMHRINALADPEWTQKYGEFIEATYTGQRLLDRKTKELLQICVEVALRADQEQIQAHMRVALSEGSHSTGDTGSHAGRYRTHGSPGFPPRCSGLGRRNRLPILTPPALTLRVLTQPARHAFSHRPACWSVPTADA